MSRLLFEIGVEEIPARFIPQAIEDIKRLTEESLKEGLIGFKSIVSYGTPRRLAVIVDGLPKRQGDRKKEIIGPPKKVALSEDGSLTKAGIKFAQSQGVAPDALIVRRTEKGEYLVAIIEEVGLPVRDVLPRILKDIVLSMGFPKSMRWAEGSLRFVRPIRWLCAMIDSLTLSVEIDGLRSANLTMGHRFLSPGPFQLPDAGLYEEFLERHFVVVDHIRREALIRKQIDDIALSKGAEAVVDDGLIKTVTHLVEYPYAIYGEFEKKYLRLPDELLSIVMMSHQKYFPLKGRDGSLINGFIVVSNTKEENSATVRVGAERVIRARLEDARFYFEEDTKRPLIERLEELKRVTFYESLGSLYDKTLRVKDIAVRLLERLYPDKPNIKPLLERAALLSRCDLVTGVVREFPELQGIMGMHYAEAEDISVRQALRDLYRYDGYKEWPEVSSLLALADRIDSIVSFFSVGQRPTGSQDPFALRRQAIGIISLLIEQNYTISIRQLIETTSVKREQIGELIEFFLARLEPILESKGYKGLIDAVIGFSPDRALPDIIKRLDALREFMMHPQYPEFITAIKRVRNILSHSKGTYSFRAELLREEQERALADALNEVRKDISYSIKESDYRGALESALRLTGPINRFFDSVMVMDKDEDIKNNRLSLLYELSSTISQIADLSRL